jgi:hypothetical protein
VISTRTKQVINIVRTGGNPQAIAITNDGDVEDNDEKVFVTRFFSELIAPGRRPDGFDDAKQGVVNSFGVGDALSGGVRVARHFLKPLANSGFTGDRRSFCLNTRRILQAQKKRVFFNSGPNRDRDGASQLASDVFCPDPNSRDASDKGPIANTPQGVYPNALHAALIRGTSLLIPNEGAAPEPPIQFTTNVQALIGVIDTRSGRETNRTINLNRQIAREPKPRDDAPVLRRLFFNTPSTIDANQAGTLFLVASRGANYVIEAIPDNQGRLSIGAPNNVIRYQTGNTPTGVVISSDGRRAYTNNEVSTSVTALDLVRQRVLTRDINSSNPPAPDTRAHRTLVGKLVFFTALGTPDQGVFRIPIRNIVPLQFRGKASNNAWSSCASCHDDGRTDSVAWSFETGPRKSIDLSGTFGRGRLDDQRLMNWSAVRGSPATDFDQSSRGIQGGIGFASSVPDRDQKIYNHGLVTGVTDALDAMHEWIATVRPLTMPKRNSVAIARGSRLFGANCASCHGGVKWTKSRTSPVYENDPTYPENPLGANFFQPVRPIDRRVIDAVPQIRGVEDPRAGTLFFMDDVGTFNRNNPIELRGGRGYRRARHLGLHCPAGGECSGWI